MRQAIAAVLMGAAAITYTIANAADNDRLDTLTITITGDASDKSLPLAITTVDADSLPAANDQSLQDILEPAPGLFAQNQDNAAQGLRVAIRGFGARAAFGVRGIRVLVDGVPMTLPDGQTELDALDLALLDNAQIIRGPSASLFGNAAGGALLLNSRRPAETPEARLDLATGSFGMHRLRAEGSGYYQQTGLLGSYLATEIDGFREHSATESDLINGLLEQRLGEGRLTARISSLEISAEDPGGLTAAQVKTNRRAARPQNLQFNSGEHIEQQRLALGWDGLLGSWSLQSTAYLGARDFNNRLPFTNGGQVAFDREFGGIGLSTSKHYGRQQFSGGIDLQTQADDRQRFENNDGQRGAQSLDQLEKASSAGVFLRDTIALTNSWEASLGLRYDHLRLSADDDFLTDGDDSGSRNIADSSYDANLSHRQGQRLVYVRIATAFETPTITELANPTGGGFNNDVQSSEARNYELGLKNRWRDLDYSATIYRINVDDELLPYELASQPGRSFFRNAGKTQREGIELSGGVELSPHWQLDASYAYASNEFASGNLNGNSLPGIPDQTAWASLRYKTEALQVAITGNHIGRLFAEDGNSTAVASYGLLNLQADWAFNQRLHLEAGIDNLLDKEYNDNIRINAFGGRYFEPAAGRNYRLNFAIRI